MCSRQRRTSGSSCLRCSFFARRIFHRSSSFLVGFPGPARLESTLGFTLAYLAIMLPSRCFRTLNGRIYLNYVPVQSSFDFDLCSQPALPIYTAARRRAPQSPRRPCSGRGSGRWGRCSGRTRRASARRRPARRTAPRPPPPSSA